MTPSLDEFRKRFPAIAAQSSIGDLNALLGSMTRKQIGSGDTLLSEGGKSAPLYFVMQGTLHCFLEKEGERAQIGQIVPGQFIGEISFLDGGPATATVIADTPCIFFELARPEFEALEKTHPVFASTLLRTITKLLIERLRSSDQMLYDMFIDKEQPVAENAPANPREWVLRMYERLSGYEGAKP